MESCVFRWEGVGSMMVGRELVVVWRGLEFGVICISRRSMS